MSNKVTLTIAFLLFTFSIFSQGLKQKESIKYIEINERASFYEVNEKHERINNNIYYTNPNFLINSSYHVTVIDDNSYVIFTYPNFQNGTTQQEQAIASFSLSEANPSYIKLSPMNGKQLMIEKEEFDRLKKTSLYKTWSLGLETGLLTIPFKWRPAINSKSFSMTTDVALGPYIAPTFRVSKREPYYLSLPFNAGLTYININNNNTGKELDVSEEGVVPGFTYSNGVVLSLEQFNIGLVIGWDWASQGDKNWLYQGKYWWSFSIGYPFTKPN